MSYIWYKNLRIKDPADGEGTEVLNSNFQYIADKIENLDTGVLTAFSGISGYSGISGFSGYSGKSGYSGYSGYSGSGVSGFSGYSGSGISGYSGYLGYSGTSGYSGNSTSGFSGYSGYSGYLGTSGFSGYSGSGVSGFSGYSGYSGTSGFSGYSGSGVSGFSGYSGRSGYSGYSGFSGYSGKSGYSGYSGFSGYSGAATVMTGATDAVNGTLGTVPQPLATYNRKYLRGDATWKSPYVINVKDWGAVGDGVTDDTTAIQNAIDSYSIYHGAIPFHGGSTTQSGGIIFLPSGKYKTTSPIKIRGGITLKGEGGSSSYIVSSASAARGAIEITSDYVGYAVNYGVEELGIYSTNGYGISPDFDLTLYPTKVIHYSGTAYTDYTTTNNSWMSGTYSSLTDTNDYLYIGSSSTFDSIGVLLSTIAVKDGSNPFTKAISLTIEYYNGSWTSLSYNSDSGKLSDKKIDGFFWTIPVDWATTSVNGSSSIYYIRLNTSTSNDVSPVFYNIGLKKLQTSVHVRDVSLSCQDWGIFLPGTFHYAQNVHISGIITQYQQNGVLWLDGNANYIERVNTEGGSRSSSTFNPVPAMIVCHGSGYSIRNCIIEGVSNARAFYISSNGLVFETNWVETSSSPSEIYSLIENSDMIAIGRLHGRTQFHNCLGVNISEIRGQVLSDTVIPTGNTQIYIGTVYSNYYDIGSFEHPKVKFGAFYNLSNSAFITSNNNPLTGNLIVNGDCQNGTYGYSLGIASGGAGTLTTGNKLWGEGKNLIIDITTEASSGNHSLSTVLPSFAGGYADNSGYIGCGIRVEGNIGVLGYFPGKGTSLGRISDFKSAYKIDNIPSGGTISWLIYNGGKQYGYAYKYSVGSGTYGSDVSSNIDPDLSNPSIVMFASAGDYIYLAHWRPEVKPKKLTVALAGAASSLSWQLEYWNGISWEKATVSSDTTSDFTANGSIIFDTIHTNGTSSLSSGVVTGSSTTFLTDGVVPGSKIGFGSTDPASITKWYVITSVTSDTRLTVSDSDGSAGGGSSYCILSNWEKSSVNSSIFTHWIRIKSNSFVTSPTIDTITIPSIGKVYFSDLYVVMGGNNNNIPMLSSSQRWTNGNIEMQASALPASGTWTIGDIIWNSNPSELGSASSKYTILGWRRITNGTANVLNTDWVQMRCLTGN